MSIGKASNALSPRVLALLLIGLFLSLQASAVLYQAYPLNELVPVQPSVHEVQAIQFIDSNSPERYVVLCEPGFASLAAGFLGVDYAYAGGDRGVFGIPEWYYPTVQMYVEMTKNPSIGIMQQALDFAKAKISYFVISVRNPDFDSIVDRALEIFPAYKTFGEDRLYVFWYPLPVHVEPGNTVKVIYDDGAGGEQNVSTTLVYMIESEINSTLTLTGHSSYNVTSFPLHWTFLELTVNNVTTSFDASSDVNQFVYIKNLQASDTVTVKWLFNRKYSKVGWKEDSFKSRVWQEGPFFGSLTPIIAKDGNTLAISHTFTSGPYQYFYYSTNVGISTNDYPYLLMRWRSNMPIAIAAVYFELEPDKGYSVVPIGSLSPEWSTIVVPLRADSIVRSVMVGVTNAGRRSLTGTGTMEVDYILFSSVTAP